MPNYVSHNQMATKDSTSQQMGDEYQPQWESLSENQPLYCEMSQGFDLKK